MVVPDTVGVVLRIERTSIHDGPGLRTVLFLKGCPLSCKWCSTPESQQKDPEKGYDATRCVGCSTCVLNCPAGAITLSNNIVEIDDRLCTRCFQCVDICPHSAQKGYGRLMTVSQAVAEISKDEIFFFHSGGGVTISGGECFTQPEFTAGILEECCQRGINTAIETSLLASWKDIEKSLPFLNTLYVDIKHHDSKKHKELTGVGNGKIIANLKKLDQSVLPFQLHLRVPLIPGINDSDENLSALLAIGDSLEKVDRIEILPYHRLGVATYELLGRNYHLDNLLPPSEEYLAERLAFIKKQNPSLLVKVGSGYL
jgi:pyruvate formate lyase activating enzyme